MSEITPGQYAVPHGSIQEYRAAVYFESIWLWKEKNPVIRANMARQLADWTAILSEMEAEEARKIRERSSASDEAA
jgi:tRNA A22 N-methylase